MHCSQKNLSPPPPTWIFLVSTTHPPLLKFQGISLAFCFPSKTLAFESPSLQWPYFWMGAMDVSWNIQRDSSDKWIKMNKDSGGHGFDSCRELRFFSLSHARVTLINSSFQQDSIWESDFEVIVYIMNTIISHTVGHSVKYNQRRD